MNNQPTDSRKLIDFWIERKDYNELRIYCKKNDLSISQYLRKIIKHQLKGVSA